jgi:hypothetical protein
MSETLRLSDVLQRRLALDWFEAVALTREVMDRILEKPIVLIPEPHQIEITPDGKGLVRGGVISDEAVRRMGQLLQALLLTAEPPVQLRLLVAQATAASPSFVSVREFCDALGYFERPGRAGFIQAVYSRAAALQADDATRPISIDDIAPLPNVDPWQQEDRRPAAQLNPRIVWGAALLVLTAIGAYLAYAFATSPGASESQAVQTATATVKSIAEGISSVADRAGLGQSAATPAASPAAPVTPEPAAPAPRTRPANGPRAAASQVPHPKPALGATPSPESNAAASPPQFVLFDADAGNNAAQPAAVPALAPRDLSAPAPPALAAAARRAGDGTIYSATSAGVTPPVGLRAQLPRQLPPDIDKDKLGQIELVILPDGTVGSVKLISWPTNVHEAMFLSAVKAWEFRPALKDETPVAYRKTIWVAFK